MGRRPTPRNKIDDVKLDRATLKELKAGIDVGERYKDIDDLLKHMPLKMQKFAEELSVSGNGTRSYTKAGYSATSDVIAAAEGSKLLRHPKVISYLAYLKAQRAKKLEITIDRFVQETARLAFFDIRKLLAADGSPKPPSEWDDDTAAAVSGMDVGEIMFDGEGKTARVKKIKMSSKEKALDMLGRYLGAFLADKVDPTKDGGEAAQSVVNAIIEGARKQLLRNGSGGGSTPGAGGDKTGNEGSRT